MPNMPLNYYIPCLLCHMLITTYTHYLRLLYAPYLSSPMPIMPNDHYAPCGTCCVLCPLCLMVIVLHAHHALLPLCRMSIYFRPGMPHTHNASLSLCPMTIRLHAHSAPCPLCLMLIRPMLQHSHIDYGP